MISLSFAVCAHTAKVYPCCGATFVPSVIQRPGKRRNGSVPTTCSRSPGGKTACRAVHSGVPESPATSRIQPQPAIPYRRVRQSVCRRSTQLIRLCRTGATVDGQLLPGNEIIRLSSLLAVTMPAASVLKRKAKSSSVSPYCTADDERRCSRNAGNEQFLPHCEHCVGAIRLTCNKSSSSMLYCSAIENNVSPAMTMCTLGNCGISFGRIGYRRHFRHITADN